MNPQPRSAPEFNYSVLEASKRRFATITEVHNVGTGLLGGELFYHIRVCRSADEASDLVTPEPEASAIIERRFGDFEAFHAKIRELYKAELLPALPRQRKLRTLTGDSREAEREQKEDLELYLNKVLSNRALVELDEARVFFSRVG